MVRSAEEERVYGETRSRENLDGDRALQPRVVRTVDLAHPTLADLLEKAIRPEILAALHRMPRIMPRPRFSGPVAIAGEHPCLSDPSRDALDRSFDQLAKFWLTSVAKGWD